MAPLSRMCGEAAPFFIPEYVLKKERKGKYGQKPSHPERRRRFADAKAVGVREHEHLVKLNHGVPMDFPPKVLEEAARFPDAPCHADLAGRTDLRDIPFVTIDGRTARDFDDAVHVEAREQGGWILRVGIADVTHYVRPRSALDREAFERGNSWYFPTSVEPMLPKNLSDGLCSLNPNVDRLVMAAEIRFSENGTPDDGKFYPAVIRSAARLTYGQVWRVLEDGESSDACALSSAARGEEILASLRQAKALAECLSQVRSRRGALDFDVPEAEYVFDAHGGIAEIKCRERNFAHRIIEECMIAANEAVARFLEKRGCVFPYRVHPEPEEGRLRDLFDVLKSTEAARAMPPHPDARSLQSILESVRGTEQEYLVGRLVLRTMQQARYGHENGGHFGLASLAYCHFTSPIRRYADILVHRALKEALGMHEGRSLAEHKLERMSDKLNHRERDAMEAEREMARRMGCLALSSREGETFRGVVSGVNDFGIFVELADMPVEGMVRVGDLGDDYYAYDPQRCELTGVARGRCFKLGQSLQVRLRYVDMIRLEIRLVVEGIAAGRKKVGGFRPISLKRHCQRKRNRL